MKNQRSLMSSGHDKMVGNATIPCAWSQVTSGIELVWILVEWGVACPCDEVGGISYDERYSLAAQHL